MWWMAADGSEAHGDAGSLGVRCAGFGVCWVFCAWCVFFWVVVGVAKRVKKLALVGLDPTTFGL